LLRGILSVWKELKAKISTDIEYNLPGTGSAPITATTAATGIKSTNFILDNEV
jgi:hypothetical protein